MIRVFIISMIYLTVCIPFKAFSPPGKPIEKQSEIVFTEVWVWEFLNSQNLKSEIAIYRAPKQGFWLFTSEAYGLSGEMYNWIIGRPDGSYLTSTTDEFGKTVLGRERVSFKRRKNMPSYYSPAAGVQIFNQNKLGFPAISGKEFRIDYTKTNDKSTLFLGKYKADFTPLYYFNQLNIEAKLPFWFPVDIPGNLLLLQENSYINKSNTRLTFKYISSTEYVIPL